LSILIEKQNTVPSNRAAAAEVNKDTSTIKIIDILIGTYCTEPQVKITSKHLDSKFSQMRFGGAKIQDPAQVSPHHFLY